MTYLWAVKLAYNTGITDMRHETWPEDLYSEIQGFQDVQKNEKMFEYKLDTAAIIYV